MFSVKKRFEPNSRQKPNDRNITLYTASFSCAIIAAFSYVICFFFNFPIREMRILVNGRTLWFFNVRARVSYGKFSLYVDHLEHTVIRFVKRSNSFVNRLASSFAGERKKQSRPLLWMNTAIAPKRKPINIHYEKKLVFFPIINHQ